LTVVVGGGGGGEIKSYDSKTPKFWSRGNDDDDEEKEDIVEYDEGSRGMPVSHTVKE
jgi:hypothetical protein